jgi:hypothetical protein
VQLPFHIAFTTNELLRLQNYVHPTLHNKIFSGHILALRKNSVVPEPKVYRRIHKSPPAVPFLSQFNQLPTPAANLPKIHSNPILPSKPTPPEPCPSPQILEIEKFELAQH